MPVLLRRLMPLIVVAVVLVLTYVWVSSLDLDSIEQRTLNADYKEFIDGGVNVANDRAFPYTPKMTASGNVDLRLLEGNWGRARLLLDYVHSDSYYIYPYTTRVDYSGNTAATTRADSSDVFDARLVVDRIETGKGSVEASLWVKNIFDVSDRVSGIDFGASFGHATVSYYNPPRTYGADLTFRFPRSWLSQWRDVAEALEKLTAQLRGPRG